MSQNEVQAIFKTVADSLVRQPWFKKGKWKVSTHTFPPKKPTVESFLAFGPKARRKSSVTLHLLHYDLIPGTKIKRREIAAPRWQRHKTVGPIVDSVLNKVLTGTLNNR